mgnify:FL=1
MVKSPLRSDLTSLYPILTYGGAIPFVMGAACLVVDIRSVPFLGSTADFMGAYGLVIASFLSGTHWQLHLNQNAGWSLFLALSSNVMAIGLWTAFLVLAPEAFFLALSFIFLIFLAIDHRLAISGLINKHYFKTRAGVTGIVVLSLICSGLIV